MVEELHVVQGAQYQTLTAQWTVKSSVKHMKKAISNI